MNPSANSVSIPSSRAWVVAGAAIGINLVLGSLYAWGVMAKALVVQWHWTKTQAALPFAVCTLAFSLMMIFAGRAQDRIGPRKVVALGGVIYGLGLAASAWAKTPAWMMLSFGILGGFGLGLGYSATTPPVIKWFPPARKGFITGLVVSGIGLAAVYISPLSQFLVEKVGIATTFRILGGGAFVIMILLSLLLVDPPAGFQASPASQGPAAAPAARRDTDWQEMLRTPQFYLLWAIFILSASAGLMLISNVAIIAQEQAGWKAGFVPVMLLAIFNSLGRVASGYISDRIGRTRTMLLVFLIQAINMALFAQYGSVPLIITGSALTGFCYGAIYTLMPAATADFYGVKNLGVNYGLLFTAFGVAGSLGSVLGGRVRDLFGSYAIAYWACAAMLLVAAGLALLIRAPRPAK
jgi:OFA family oxalate/formate antiporter-like MFS transporter